MTLRLMISPCWAVLGISPDSDEVEIKRAYARLVRKHPPEGDAAEFQRVREAYEQALEEKAAEKAQPPYSSIFGGLFGNAFGSRIDWGSVFGGLDFNTWAA